VLFRVLVILILSAMTVSCANSGAPSGPRPQITSCPEGLVLICETGRQQQPSKGGADEEIPQYDYCRCKPQH
jgi:hypothetical protein